MKRIFLIGLLNFSILLFFGCSDDSLQYVGEEMVVSAASEEENISKEQAVYDTITVHICGEVYFPGVYTVYSGSRIYEIVKQAGGFTEYADTESINQAKKVSDGEQIYIPAIGETEENEKQGLIDINSADEVMLCTIPGIGATRAGQIIEYREKNGDFEKVEDIMNVTGIKEGIFEKILPYITVS